MLRTFIEFVDYRGTQVILPLDSLQLTVTTGSACFTVMCVGSQENYWIVPKEDLPAFQTCMRKAGAYITSVTEQKRLDENYPLSPAITPT